MDERLSLFRSEVASIARGERLGALVEERVHELYAPMAAALFETARESAIKSVRLWRRGGVRTIDELDTLMQKEIAKALSGEAGQARIEDVLRGWLAELMQTLEGELAALCMRCGVPPERMSLSGTSVDAGLTGVRLSLTDAMGMDMLSGLMGVVLAVVGASVGGGGGLALVSAGPVGMVAGAAAGVLLALVGKAGMEKAIRRAELPLIVRQLVTDKAILRGMNRQREELERAIVRTLADPTNGFSSRLCASISRTLGAQLEEMARGAEMSICA